MTRVAVLSALAVLLAALPARATQIHFLWEETGTASMIASPDQEIVLQAWVLVESPGLTGASVSALAPTGLLEAVAFAVCPEAPGNLFAGACGDEIGNTLGPIGVSNVVLNEQNAGSPGGTFDPTPVPGLSGSFGAAQFASLPGIPADSSFVLAEVTFRVVGTGSGEVLPYYRAGFDGVRDVGSDVYVPPVEGADATSGVTLMVVPEPGTLGLLGAGVALLGAARGRRG